MTLRGSRTRRVVGGVLLLLALLVLLLAAFPWGLLAGRAEGPLSRALGRSVRIGQAERIGWFSFHPVVELRDVTVGQPTGFGTAPLARIASARVGFAALPLLIGRFRPEAVEIGGARLLLLRHADGTANWDGDDKQDEGGGSRPSLAALTVRDTAALVIDDKRHVRLDAAIVVDPRTGLSIDGTGTHRGTPLRLTLHAADLATAAPVQVAVRSSLASLSGTVTPDRAFDFVHFAARITASGTDLTYLDDIIQAGMFPTRPFQLAGRIRRDGPDWKIEGLKGRIGRSIVATSFTVAKRNGRTVLNGEVDAPQFDFDDFSSASGRAEAAARQARIGDRVIPATKIEFDELGKLDGVVTLRAHRLLSSGPSAFQSLTTTATMDRQRLELYPLRSGLRSGTLTGRAIVDDRTGTPKLSLDLRIAGARIEKLLLPGDAIDGPLAAHVRLTGRGSTVRAALARASGKVGLAVSGGTVRRDYAIFAGGDLLKSVGRIIGGNKGERSAVRCLIGEFAVANGVMVPRPLVLDADIVHADGTGRILLADERIALSLRGRAKNPGAIQSTAPVLLGGTLSDPKLDIRPPRAEKKGEGGVFERIGFLIKGLKTGKKAESSRAPPGVDCAGLRAAALG